MGDQVMGEQPSQPISAYLLGCDQLNAIIQRNSWARKRASSELVLETGFWEAANRIQHLCSATLQARL